jgi:hypothetical protein
MYLIYLGGGWLPGVPSRNLTKDEAELYGVQVLLDSGLYKLATPKKEKKEGE